MYVDRMDLAALAIILVLAFGAYVYFFAPSPSIGTSLGADKSGRCAGVDGPAQRTDCYADIAAKAGLSACAGSPDGNACAGHAAFQKADASVCRTWTDPDGCTYFYLEARLSHNETPASFSDAIAGCMGIAGTGWRISCLEAHAAKRHDAAYCAPIQIPSYKDQCIRMVNGPA